MQTALPLRSYTVTVLTDVSMAYASICLKKCITRLQSN
uniref:Uncharacterized protein n=1 Tax=Anguilla anguilla TaxID=7936 RepID=A0A0E9RGF2_ANGAN